MPIPARPLPLSAFDPRRPHRREENHVLVDPNGSGDLGAVGAPDVERSVVFERDAEVMVLLEEVVGFAQWRCVGLVGVSAAAPLESVVDLAIG
jgi:hypothetical protein